MSVIDRATATRFTELEVRGSPREMGRQFGEATRDLFPNLLEHVMMRLNQYRAAPLDLDSALQASRPFFRYVEEYSPDSMAEARGFAEGARVSPEAVMLVNARSEIAEAVPEAAGCTTVAANAEASASGAGVIGQNWDNDPGMDPFSLVLTRRPEGKPAFLSFTQAGIIAYMGLSEAGIGVCMNALPGRPRAVGLPWYFAVRGVYEAFDRDGAIAAVERAERARSGNLALMTPQGALDIEAQVDSLRLLAPDDSGRLVHTNHCLHPDLANVNEEFADSLYGQTREREARARSLFAASDTPVSVAALKRMLSDHDGEPTSICRHPNDDSTIGWQRSVVSMIVEPAQGKMHLSRGNPCENPYEVYSLN